MIKILPTKTGFLEKKKTRTYMVENHGNLIRVN